MRTKVTLEDKYALDVTRAYITGIEALVRLPMLQHQRDQDRGLNTAGFVSGYRGSPLGNFDQAMWKAQSYLDKHNIKFMPAVNEDLAATAVWGSQQVNIFEGARYDGVFGMWYGKGPGVDRSMDVIKHANAFGTSKYGGVLAIAGDDHACKSSTLPHQSEHNFIGASIPVLNPANVQEVLDLGIFGWELSRYSGCWVALKAITENMDSAISAEIDPHRINIVIPEEFELPADGVHARWPDTALDQELRLNKFKIYAAREFARVNHLDRIVIDSPNPRLGIITTGKSYLDVMQALEDLGIDAALAANIGLRVYKVGMSWPLEPVMTHEFAKGLEEILVVEEKRSIIEDQLTGQLYNWPVDERPRVFGEFDENGNDLLPNLGELTPAAVARAIASRTRRFYSSEAIENRLEFLSRKERALQDHSNLLERTPHYCSGCPHNTSTRVPEGSRSLAGIGCHYMANWMPGDRRADTFTQMGGEGITWVGQAFFTDTKHVFQNLGDGTYFHSGTLAIRQAIAAGVNITYKILYNDAVAMTGGQPLDGSLSVNRMILQLRGEGVERIAVVTDEPGKYGKDFPRLTGVSVDHRDRLMGIQKELRDIEGTTVLIYDQTCAAELRRRRKKGLAEDPERRIFINEAVCEGCGDCGVASNCLSVVPYETELGRKRRIDQNACNKDYSCVNGFCPSFVSVIGGSLKKKPVPDHGAAKQFSEPVLPGIERPWNIVVAGVGGTGVLTVSALIAMAAHIEGKGCATMNQTGLAQKFGAVVSHVRIGETQDSIKAVRIAAGDADLLLGCDLVVSASFDALAKANTERSFAVVNDAMSPTADFVHDPDAEFPAEAVKAAIRHEVGDGKVHFVDATGIATSILSDSIGSNLFLLGFAFQKGLIPVGSTALEQAIEMNNVAVEFNKKAFYWGRKAAEDLEYVKKVAGAGIAGAGRFEPLDLLQEIIADRRVRLIKYQHIDYADEYVRTVERVRKAERAISGSNEVLSKTVARNLFKVMAYKDEYEVARLFSDGQFKQKLAEHFEGDYKLKFHLAPPLLSRRDADTGRLKKRTFPAFTMTIFSILARLKFLRGTFLDVFGYSEERKMERRLIEDYKSSLNEIVSLLSRENMATAIELAGLPEKIRGFGHVKEKNARAARERRSELMSRLTRPGSLVKLVEVEKGSSPE